MSKEKLAVLQWRGLERAGYTVQEVISMTGLSRSFIYRAISEGRLQGVRVGARKLIITAAALDKFLEG